MRVLLLLLLTLSRPFHRAGDGGTQEPGTCQAAKPKESVSGASRAASTRRRVASNLHVSPPRGPRCRPRHVWKRPSRGWAQAGCASEHPYPALVTSVF